MPTYETNGTLTTTTKSFSSPKQPDLTGLVYSLNGQSITLDVVGSPGTSSEERVTVNLDGSTSYTIRDQWTSDHTDFRLEYSLSTSDNSQTPSVDDTTVEVLSFTASGSVELVTSNTIGTAKSNSNVDALRNSFDIINRTGIGESIADAIVSLATANASTVQSAVSKGVTVDALVSATSATTNVAEGFSETTISGLESAIDSSVIVGDGDAVAVPLVTTTSGSASPSASDVDSGVFAVVTPPPIDAETATSGINTSSSASGDATAVASSPVSPTTDIVVLLQKTGVGLEGAFADSLAASVGAQTTIKVAKTNARATDSTIEPYTTTDIFGDTTTSTTGTMGSSSSTSTPVTNPTTASGSVIGSSASSSDAALTPTPSTMDVLGGSGFAESVVGGVVRGVIASELDASGSTHAMSEALAAVADGLTEVGLVDTSVEAAALVSTVVSNSLRSGLDTSVAVPAATTSLDMIDRTSIGFSQAHPLINPTLVSTLGVRSNVTATAVGGTRTNMGILPLSTLVRLYYTARRGSNYAIVTSEQNVRVTNSENTVLVQD